MRKHFCFLLRLTISSILWEDNLHKPLRVISLFTNSSIWGPISGYNEQEGIPQSRICGSEVLLSVHEDSETYQLPSFGGLYYPTGDRLIHKRSPPILVERGQHRVQDCSSEWGRGKATVPLGKRGKHGFSV